METKPGEDWQILTLKIRVMWSQAKERQGHQKLEIGKASILPVNLWREQDLKDIFGFQYSDTQFGLLSLRIGRE